MELKYRNAPEAYYDLLYQMKLSGVEEDSRAGKVIRIPEPVLVTLTHPTERVITDPIRDANPFFHLFESIWMLGGHDDVEWLLQFNSQFGQFAESDGTMRGAYGKRWRYHFGIDQLITAVKMLQDSPSSRRVVLGMWDAGFDLGWEGAKDYPCNTHIYVDLSRSGLDFTVCNRSNDLVWGLAGSNIVHMTILQEVLASALGVLPGKYRVFTNNLHMYKERADFDKLMASVPGPVDDVYIKYGLRALPITPGDGDPFVWFKQFLHECKSLSGGWDTEPEDYWLRNVAWPMLQYHRNRVDANMNQIQSEDWRWAAKMWNNRRDGTSSSSTSTGRSLTMNIEPITLESRLSEIGPPTSPPAEETDLTTPSSSS
jgi:Thymidylate synthase